MMQNRRQTLKTLSGPLLLAATGTRGFAAARATSVSIQGNAFHINGKPTYPGRSSTAARSKASCSPRGW